MWRNIMKKLAEAVFSVLPISISVIILALTQNGISGGLIGAFCIGTVMLIVGMVLFTLGSDMAMMPMGDGLGGHLSKSRKLWLIILVCLVLGFLITVAEPDLQVLTQQLGNDGEKNILLLYSVALGVGVFLVVSLLRTFFRIKLSYILIGFYVLVFILAIFVPKDFLAIAFDSGGVTTGPITVPFLMSLGIGLAAVRGGKSTQNDSFGMIALCSIGPILAVMILGISGKASMGAVKAATFDFGSFAGIMKAFVSAIPSYFKEVALALLPIVFIFALFQIFALKFPKERILRIIVGIVYTYVGLVIFLVGVNVGFMPMGKALGASIAATSYKYVILPFGMVMGCFIILAEPAVHILTKQVEQISGGAIPKRLMLVSLSVGVALAVGLSMLRVLTGLPILYILIPCYALALILTVFVPPIFTAIAFDSGGVASGPMTATFLLPFAIGACGVVGGNVLTDAYGLVAFVAVAPLCTIQLVGLAYKIKTKIHRTAKLAHSPETDDDVIDFEVETETIAPVVAQTVTKETETETPTIEKTVIKEPENGIPTTEKAVTKAIETDILTAEKAVTKAIETDETVENEQNAAPKKLPNCAVVKQTDKEKETESVQIKSEEQEQAESAEKAKEENDSRDDGKGDANGNV